jgi:N-acetylmuramoyl-L-alanine amidase CwlA
VEIKQMLLTPSKYNRPQVKIKPTAIAWHYVGNPNTSAIANRNYFENLRNTHQTYASSHFIIGLKGEILQLIPENEKSFCTNWANNYTISVECCHPDKSGKFTEETYRSMIWLGKYLMKKHGIKENIRHYDVTKKVCPKWFVDNPNEWIKFKKRLEDEVMLEELISKYGENNVKKALEELIIMYKNKEKVSDWAKVVFEKSTRKDKEGNAIINGNGKGEYDWQVPVTLERLMVILDKLGVLEGFVNE